MKTLLELRFPLGKEIMTTVRLATGGVCSLLDLDVDACEDCKVSVTESLLLLEHAGWGSATLSFREENGLFIGIAGEGELGIPDALVRAIDARDGDEISYALLSALVEDLSLEREDGALRSVSFRFGK